MAVDRRAAEAAIWAFLEALGHDPDSVEELRETPARVAEAYANDLLSGEQVDIAAAVTAESAPADSEGLVVVRDIAITTLCPHHLLPASGRATVAYLPGGRLLGIGAVARLVDASARRLTLQEQIGDRVVAALMEHAAARGAWCRLELVHSCMVARGVRQAGAAVVTVASAGALAGEPGNAALAAALGFGA